MDLVYWGFDAIVSGVYLWGCYLFDHCGQCCHLQLDVCFSLAFPSLQHGVI